MESVHGLPTLMLGERLWEGYFHNAPHGMVLFKAVRTEAGRLDDFEWCDLNESAAAALEIDPMTVVGNAARSVRESPFDPRVYRRLVTAHVTKRVQEFEQVFPTAPAAGAQDGLTREGRENLMWYAVTVIPLDDQYLIVQFRSITHYKSVLRQAVELLNRDDLTGLANRRHLKTRFWVLRRRSVPMALLYFDLNGFKAVNDTYGHEVGDQVLSIIGQRLTTKVRPDEMVARLGGDEFAVLLAGGDLSAVDRVTGRLIEVVEEPIHLEPGTVRLSASVGAALYPDDAESFEALVSRADARMYEQKRKRTLH
ncbi:MAG: GGDEF domain-containing protein [Trueperaceae bacterium]|nr:GGDEF domain-containing protein [Trueperaceae bacterium]